MNQKTVIVTGGAQSIGRAITQKLLRENHRVAVFDNDQEALAELPDLFNHDRQNLITMQCDVSDESAVKKALEHVRKRWNHIDYLVNNAGIWIFKPITDLTLDEWNQVIQTNLTSMFLMVKYTLPLFRNGTGAIVNIASTRAMQSEPHSESYSASKGGVVALTHAMAMSFGPSIRVNSVSPGWIDTTGFRKRKTDTPTDITESDHSQHPAGRVGIPDDVADMTSFLLSEQAAFITGQNFTVDGGMTRKMIYL